MVSSRACWLAPRSECPPGRRRRLPRRLRRLLSPLQSLRARGETASQLEKVSNPPPEANLAAGFLVLAPSRVAPAVNKEPEPCARNSRKPVSAWRVTQARRKGEALSRGCWPFRRSQPTTRCGKPSWPSNLEEARCSERNECSIRRDLCGRRRFVLACASSFPR